MKRMLVIVLSLGLLFSLSGCWNKFELTDWAFVQAIAIDDSPDGKLQLTTHFYKPGGGGSLEGGQQGPAAFNITTKADSVFEAIRDIPLRMGRKAQWSHMRIIVISEQIGKKRNVQELTDFFVRDHEPRDTVTVIMAKGEAKDFLAQKPFIESTIGQQLKEMSQSASRFSAKSKNVNLLDLAIQFRGQTGIVLLPYTYMSDAESKDIALSKLAVIKDGRVVDDFMNSANVESLLMLRDEFQFGILEVPCKDKNNLKETFEITSLQSTTRIKPKQDTVSVRINTKIKGSFSEIRCTSALNSDAEKQVAGRIRDYVEKEQRKTIALAQSKKLDLLGIGDWLYRHHPALWMQWKSDWDDRFARADFDIHIDVQIINSGVLISKPYYE
ncbi:Ger(x)C family spore germination protein [Paenibacillus contaminans]|uniref:Ger(X)C family spore germination protein n=1 Tax=Paenibacillus contaminans TaxID=450362 RepID=A0A329MU48_9BACL|nr:Ger(x)C family spore germination protein [Paenibacillus contaminans]RAV23192.1 Ger(x)C family spore germination protein [Paenibacillus contaminans]